MFVFPFPCLIDIGQHVLCPIKDGKFTHRYFLIEKRDFVNEYSLFDTDVSAPR